MGSKLARFELCKTCFDGFIAMRGYYIVDQRDDNNEYMSSNFTNKDQTTVR